ncbi:hypothetical protein N0V88_007817 [Collariella sp. IMI 366227]|nr:hypothetical protein N0V88_007817 [Collariella sp. IMI 366227]
MASQYHYEAVGQPGLEVAQHPVGELEVAGHQYSQYSHLPEVQTGDYNTGKEPAVTKYPGPGYSDDPELYTAAGGPASPGKTGRKRLWIIVGAAIAVVVIAGAVLGGVFGSRAAKSSADASASQTDGSGDQDSDSSNKPPVDPPSNTTSGPQMVRKGSSLSVTGWRRPDGSLERFLFYQGVDGALHYSRCDTNLLTAGNESTCWQEPVSFDSFANASTPLAASTILFRENFMPQVELFYIGFKNRFFGVSFNEKATPPVSEDSVNTKKIITHVNSSVAAYWPWTIYQNPEGVLYHVRNLQDRDFRASSYWDNNRINITALTGSRLAVVPMSTHFDRIAIKGGYAVFYQDVNEKLAVSVTDLTSPELKADYALSWPVEIPDITLPERTPMAGFSVARKGDDKGRVETYLLYLGPARNINVLYTDSSVSPVQWRRKKPEAMQGADENTDISCLTMASTLHNTEDEEGPLPEPADDTMRCYFQRGGKVVEVKLDLKGDCTIWMSRMTPSTTSKPNIYPNHTPYTLLGVTVTSSKSEITEAYERTVHVKQGTGRLGPLAEGNHVLSYEKAYETVMDPLKRCLWHCEIKVPDWYGMPTSCLGERAVNKLKAVKGGVKERGTTPVKQQQRKIHQPRRQKSKWKRKPLWRCHSIKSPPLKKTLATILGTVKDRLQTTAQDTIPSLCLWLSHSLSILPFSIPNLHFKFSMPNTPSLSTFFAHTRYLSFTLLTTIRTDPVCALRLFLAYGLPVLVAVGYVILTISKSRSHPLQTGKVFLGRGSAWLKTLLLSGRQAVSRVVFGVAKRVLDLWTGFRKMWERRVKTTTTRSSIRAGEKPGVAAPVEQEAEEQTEEEETATDEKTTGRIRTGQALERTLKRGRKRRDD